MNPNQIDDSLSKQLPSLEEWPLPSDNSHEGRVEGHASGEVQDGPQENGYMHLRSSSLHINTAEIGRALPPGPCPGSYTRSRRGPPSVAHSVVSPSISESGEGEDPSSVRPHNFQDLQSNTDNFLDGEISRPTSNSPWLVRRIRS